MTGLLPSGLKPTTITNVPGATATSPYGDADVAKQVAAVASETSPLMEQAKTAGLQTANKRGMLNSSMAIGAAQGEVLKVATPIGSQNAAQIHARNVSDQNYQQEGALQTQRLGSAEKMQQADIASLEKRAAEDIAARERMLGRQLTAEEERQIRQIASTETMQQRDSASRDHLLTRELTSREGLMRTELGSRETMQQRELASSSAERLLDRALQERIANMNLTSSDRQTLAQMLMSIESTYQSGVATVNNNTNIAAADRQNYLAALSTAREQNLTFAESLFTLDLPGAGSTPPAPAPAPPSGGGEPAPSTTTPDTTTPATTTAPAPTPEAPATSTSERPSWYPANWPARDNYDFNGDGQVTEQDYDYLYG